MINLTKASLAVLTAVVAATNENSFVYTDEKARKQLVKEGLVEVNETITNDAGEFATRATEKGIAEMQTVNEQGNNTNTTAATSAVVSSFAVVGDVPMPGASRGGRASETYPFDKLEAGQSFFVPATESKPNPAKSLASTVTSANERYSEVVEGEFRTNRKGNSVPATRQIREFAVRTVADGAPWGFPGVTGAGVWRTL